MGVINEYKAQRFDYESRAQIVSQCDPNDDDFCKLINTALLDSDKEVRNQAIRRYEECPLELKKRIVPTEILLSWIWAVNIEQCVVAIDLLIGRDDIDIQEIRSLFFIDDCEVRDQIVYYYQEISLEVKERLFPADILKQHVKPYDDEDIEEMWIKIFVSYCSAKGDEMDADRDSIVCDYISNTNNLDCALSLLKSCSIKIRPNVVESLLDVYEDSGECDDDWTRRNVVKIIYDSLDYSSLDEDTIKEWLFNYSSYNCILTEVMILLMIEEKMQYDEDIFRSEQYFLWSYMYRTSRQILDDDEFDAKKRFNDAYELYKRLSLEMKQVVAPEGGCNNSIGYRVDESDYIYMIIYLCYGRTDLSDSTIRRVIRYMDRFLDSSSCDVFRESLNSIYYGRFYDSLSQANNDEEQKIANGIREIRRLIELENDVLEEGDGIMRCGLEDTPANTQRNVMDAIFVDTDTKLSADMVMKIIDGLDDIDAGAVMHLPQLDDQYRLSYAIKLAANRKYGKEMIAILSNHEESWSQLADDVLVEMSGNDYCSEAALFAIDASMTRARDASFRKKILFNAVSGSRDGNVVVAAVERAYNCKDLREVVLPALQLRQNLLDPESARRVRDIVAANL